MEYLKYLSGTDDPGAIINDLMLAYGQDIWKYAYFITKRKDAADDISQEVFLQAFKNLDGFQGKSSPKTWLLAITRNRSLNYLKSAFMKRIILVGEVHRSQKAKSAENEALDRYQVGRIWQHVMQLPVKYREVLLLEVHYELPYQEIAALLGVSEGTVKSRIHRARSKIENALKGDLSDDR